MDINLRDWVVTANMAKDVTETEQLKPGAHKTVAENSKNETKQYETNQKAASGPLGAQNSGS